MKLTHSLLQVMVALMDEPTQQHWGYDLSRRSGIRSGVLYPILHRMLDEEWLIDGWQDASDTNGRPPRRYYLVTPEGMSRMGTILRDARSDSRFRSLSEGLA